MAKMVKEKVDPFQVLQDRTKRLSAMYADDPFWQAMKAGCDAIESGNVTQEVIDLVRKEHDCWGPAMSNRKALGMVLEKLQEV